MAFLISTLLLTSFAILALIDGFYLHLIKYQLFNHLESQFEHLTHTVRAFLFPLIVCFLFLPQNCFPCFYIGISFVLLDILVLGIDAWVEKDSRTFMGGLPRWEYILHLFVNGFHFASIAVFLAIKMTFADNDLVIVQDLSGENNYALFQFVAKNLIPGAAILAMLHILTILPATRAYWNHFMVKWKCC